MTEVNGTHLNKITQGDSIEEMRKLADKSVDMILCDLPYGTTRNKWDSVIPLEPLWAEYERIVKDNGAIVLTAQTPFDKVLGVSNLKLLKYEWIWQKEQGTGHLNAKRMPMKEHENILVFYKKQPTYNPQIVGTEIRTVTRGEKKSTNYGNDLLEKKSTYMGRSPKTILKFSRDKEKLHPTQKPLKLFEYLLLTYSNEGDVILDNCIGSGTTAVAALNTNRNFIGIEREPEYVAIANQRITEARK